MSEFIKGLSPLALIGGPDVSGDFRTTNETLAVGASVASSIDRAGDLDVFKIFLTAGQSYRFDLAGYGASPLVDPFIELRDWSSVSISDDDGGPGMNASLRFTPKTSGTYYVTARDFLKTDIGDYSLSVTPVAAQDPLRALTLGYGLPGPVIKVYFAGEGETYLDQTTSRGWQSFETPQALMACAAFSAVCGVRFEQVTTAAEASLILGIGVLEPNVGGQTAFLSDDKAVALFNPQAPGWSFGLGPGGHGYRTLIHEIGHALGLAHPHDDGGASEVMEGVSSPFNSFGSAGLNQGVFTTMSYNRGWANGPMTPPTNVESGVETGPMALDIAVLQQRYGAVTAHTGDDTYLLPWVNTPPVGYTTLIDSGGVDTIAYHGPGGATIDLRAATLTNTPGGGGYVSFVGGIYGGFTIAAGSVIENAVGGAGRNTLIGNDAANRLTGWQDSDELTGRGGNDILDGGKFLSDTAHYEGPSYNYAWTKNADKTWTVRDLRTGSPDGTDTLIDIEQIQFANRSVSLEHAGQFAEVTYAYETVMRRGVRGILDDPLIFTLGRDLDLGSISWDQAVEQLVKAADGTTAVASLSYQFFTGKIPTASGFDYLVSPQGPNANNINSGYYQSFNTENRYINFAVNLGKLGEGRAGFETSYGALSLADATAKAYQTIFGSAPTAEKVHALLDPLFTLSGQTMSRADYFAYYGRDGLDGIGTKAAMVGWLLAEAEKADIGTYARSNAAFLTDLVDGAEFAVDLIGTYARSDYALIA